MSQTAYNMAMDTAVQGDPADSAGSPKNVVSFNNPVDEIKFGVGVAQVSADDNSIELPDSSGANFAGVALRDLTEPNGSAGADNTYPANSSVAVLRKGRVWVQVEEAVTPDDDVYCRHTASGGNTQLGAFRTDDDTAKAIQVTQARWVTSTTGPGIAILELNLP